MREKTQKRRSDRGGIVKETVGGGGVRIQQAGESDRKIDKE